MTNAPICTMVSKSLKRCPLIQLKVKTTRTTIISKVCPNPFVLSFKTKLQTEEVLL